MGFTPLQVCMDSSDWLQGTMHNDDSSAGGAINSSSSPSGDNTGDMMTCSGPTKLKPPQDQAQKCPRCDSAHTKFCYYNNYSLSQPRYFCKTCRRYWTKGGTLRNIPVGGGCRKTPHKKQPSSKKPSADHVITVPTTTATTATNLQLSSFIGSHHNTVPNFLDSRYGPVDFSETKQLESLRNYDFMGNFSNNNIMMGQSQSQSQNQTSLAPSFQGLCSPFGVMTLEHGNNVNNNGHVSGGYADTYQRFMLAYDVAFDHQHQKLLGLDQWQEQGCLDTGNRDSFAGYLNGTGSWNGVINGYGSSAANPLL